MRGGIEGKESKEKEKMKCRKGGRKGRRKDRKAGIEEGGEGRGRMIHTEEARLVASIGRGALKKISVIHVIKLGFAPVSFPPG